MDPAGKPDYTIFTTEKVNSEKWNAEERALIKRAFELKRLKVVSRGEHQHEITVRGASISPEAAGMLGAEFEWAVVMHATEILSKLDVFMRKWSVWQGFVANPLREPFRAAAEKVGLFLGYAVAFWNDLGTEWKDLWDHFEPEMKPGEEQPRWQGFLSFYGVLQAARSDPEGFTSLAELAEKTVLKIVDVAEGRKRSPFAEDAEILHLLELCKLSPEELTRLKWRYTYWTALQNVPYWQTIADPSNSPLQVHFDVSLIAENRSLWGKTFAEMFQQSGMINFLNYAWLSGIRFEIDRNLTDAGACRITCAQRNGVLNFHCLVSLNDQKCSGLFHTFVALLHEVGHFVQGAPWMMELALADLLSERCSAYPGIDSLRFVQARQDVQRRIAFFHSAAEVGADEFVVSILLPDEKIRKLYEKNCEGDQFRAFDFLIEAASVLGLKTLDAYQRFEPIVSDHSPKLTWPAKQTIRQARLREARRKISEERIMRLMDGFWREISEIVRPAMGRA